MSSSPPQAKAQHPLRIVHVVDSLEVGGLERVTASLAMAQQARGHHVSVFSIVDTDGLKSELQQAGIPVIEGHKQGSLDRQTLGMLRGVLQAQDADIVHAHNYVPNYHAALAALGLRCRQVCTVHDMGHRLSHGKLRMLFKLSLWRTRQVAAVGRQVFERQMALGTLQAGRAHVVLNGIPVAQFTPDAHSRTAARQALQLADDDLVIGCVGRLVPLKNHHRMIAVMPELLARHPRLKLVLLGSGEREAALQAQVRELGLQDQVLLAGHRPDVSRLLAAFDIFALPSQTEGLSIALLEACATGLAVVATAVGGNPEIIQHQHTGLLIPADDNAALAQALNTLLDDPGLRQQLGLAAQQWVRDHGSVEALADAYDHVYAQALA